MANSMTGKIHKIMPTETIVSKKDPTRSFLKRTIVLDCTRFDQYTGERGFDNFPSFDFSGDKCAELDSYQVGQIVTITFDLQGNKYTDSNGKEKYFTSIRGFKIEVKGQTQQSNNTTTPIEQVSQQLQNHGFVDPPANIANDNDPLPF
jgi:hypothetical protein